MKKLLTFVLTMGLCAGFAAPTTSVSAQRSAGASPFIVIFNDNAQLDSFQGNYHADERAGANPRAWNYLNRGVAGAVQAYERAHGFKADHVYSAAVRGFAARLTADQIRELENDPAIAYIEPDGIVEANAQTVPYGITKIGANVSSTLAGNGSGSINNVNAYVIDTGVDASHPDLNAILDVNFAGGPFADCNGHGTHVSGTIGAKDDSQYVVGVAPGVRIHGVKVLGCNGSGSNSGVVKGIDWVTANAIKPAVANMSLGGGVSQATDDAVKRSVASGVFYALSSGNSGANACNYSPARIGASTNGVATTNATDSADRETSWSNYGSCTDIWAPGASILSTKKGGGTTTMSGTSMASPHVAGAGALYLSTHPTASPASVESALKGAANILSNKSKDGTFISRLWVGGF